MAVSRLQTQFATSGRGRRAISLWLLAPAFLLVGGLGGVLLARLDDAGLAAIIGRADAVGVVAQVPPDFGVCVGRVRIDCVVDGDTFWLGGTKIRIADIDTPEVGKPACAGEAALGMRATARLETLLKAGPFELHSVDRDEDVYGRKLRTVLRDGRSIGDTLVAEGLAHPWLGYQEDWC